MCFRRIICFHKNYRYAQGRCTFWNFNFNLILRESGPFSQGIIRLNLMLIFIGLNAFPVYVCLLNVYIGFIGLVGEFDIIDKNTTTHGLPYDYQSVMQLGLYAFTSRKKRSMVALKSTGRASHTTYPSRLDILHVNIMYCGGNIYMFNYSNYVYAYQKV